MISKLDPTLSKYLLMNRNKQKPCDSFGKVLLQSNTILPYIDIVTSLDQLLNTVFPDMDLCGTNLSFMVNRAILTPKNNCVIQINNLVMKRFPSAIVKYYRFDQILITQSIFY